MTASRTMGVTTLTVWQRTSIKGWLYSSTTYINGVPSHDWNTQEEIAIVAVEGWMNSQGHRENILDPSYDRAGIGVAIAEDDRVYITQNFC